MHPPLKASHRRPAWFLPIHLLAILLTLPAQAVPPTTNPSPRDNSLSPMRSIIEHDTSDRGALERRYDTTTSDSGRKRMQRFFDHELHALQATDFEALDQPGRIDYLLLRNKLQ